MATGVNINPLTELDSLLTASQQSYESCIDSITHQHVIRGADAITRLHHLKFNGNGQPKLIELAECLVRHVIDYAISARNRPETITSQEAVRLTQEARKLFRATASEGTADHAGEAGELLLYFLLEAVLKAPQVIAKIELKTNPALEINGSDGIHMRWHPTDQLVDVYFGEAKLYTDVGAAITAALNSIEAFHANGMRRHEFAMVTKHFKGLDDNLKKAVIDVLDSGTPGPAVRINHGCLIGYNWSPGVSTPQQALSDIIIEFQREYLADSQRLHDLLQNRFNARPLDRLKFEFFFLPFTDVQEFRNAFHEELS